MAAEILTRKENAMNYEDKYGDATRVAGWITVLYVLAMFSLGAAGYEAVLLYRDNIALKQQIEQAKMSAGKPIGVGELMDGQYMRSNDQHYAFVQACVDFPVGPQGPVIAVAGSSPLPETFTIKDGRTPDGITGWHVEQHGPTTVMRLKP